MANTMLLANPYRYSSTLNMIQPLQFGDTAGGSGFTYIKETASQTYAVNDLIYLDSNGTIAICTTTAGATGGNVLNSAIAGQATQKATGVTGTQVYGTAIRPDELWVMNLYHHTAASAVGTQAMLGTVRGIQKTVTTDNVQAVSVWAVDIENAVENTSVNLAYVQIVGYPTQGLNSAGQYVSNGAFGDTYALAIVKFLPYTFKSNGTTFQRNLQLA